MKRIAVAVALLASLSLGVATPVAAAELDARILGITPGFRQELVDVEGVTYDPQTGVATVTLTVHCFVGRIQFDADTYSEWMVSGLEAGPDAAVVQRGKPLTSTSSIWDSSDAIHYDSITITDADPCEAALGIGIVSPDHTLVLSFSGLKPGYATFLTTVNTGIFSGHVSTTTLIRAVLPAG